MSKEVSIVDADDGYFWNRAVLVGVITVLVLFGLFIFGPVSDGEAVFGGVNGRIAFARDGDIFTMDPDGSNVVQLTANTDLNFSPKWSPDGTKLVFASIGDSGFSDILVMNADGSGVSNLTAGTTFDVAPTWSPDGGKIAWLSNRSGNGNQVHAMNTDGSGVVEITSFDPGGGGISSLFFDIDWSSSGKIVYGSTDGLWVMNPDGSGLTSLGAGVEPNWAPDGSKIVFATAALGIGVMNADGSGVVMFPFLGQEPGFSPDGNKITFVGLSIDVVNADGSGRTTIDDSAGSNQPDWGPSAEAPPPPPPDGPFDDVPASHQFADDIEWMADQGITLGCNPEGTLYCPTDSVTRAQMASFLVRALDLLAVAGNRFSDVSGTHTANINALAEAGVTLGCNAEGTLFCPDDKVTREQMGSFLARALELPPVAENRFTDVSGGHTANINAIAEAGITLGCNPEGTLYCPRDFVTRGQMAAFLHRALG